MSDKLKTAADAAAPIVEVVTNGAKAAAHAPVVVETAGEAVDVLVEIVEKSPLNKKFLIGGAVALGLAGLAGGIYWATKRRSGVVTVEEVAEETAHKVAEVIEEAKKVK